MGFKLIVIESSGKISVIQKIIGSAYKIIYSGGHIMELDPKKLSVDVNNRFTPTYIIPSEKRKIDRINDLKRNYKKSDDIILATDPDREGEAIAWSIAQLLNLKNPKRIAFSSITKKAINDALKNPRKIDDNLVNAQKARRILDRLVGYKISPLLWKSITGAKSAGRVQSVILRIIVDKENEIKNFFEQKENSFFHISGNFLYKKNDLHSELYKYEKTKKEKAKINDKKNAEKIMKKISLSKFTIKNMKESDGIRNPQAPFCTSTLQQEATKIGMTLQSTMRSAQNLYEAGYISYMRTDSITLTNETIKKIKKVIQEKYGDEYYKYNKYKSKNKNTQEAHEAIHPTHPETIILKKKNKIGDNEIKLYNLIWRRTIASQMVPAKLKIINIEININKLEKYIFMSKFENIIYKGFLIVYENNEHKNKNIDIKINDKIDAKNILCNQEYDKPPKRYNEGSLVKKLNTPTLTIGRPATNVSEISTIQERNYIIKSDIDGIKKKSITFYWEPNKEIKENVKEIVIGNETNKLVPTNLGIIVTDFLVKYFPDIMDYQFTAKMEDLLDEIASGTKVWYNVLQTFYDKFNPTIEKLIKLKLDVKKQFDKKLGIDPQTKCEVIAFITNKDPMVKLMTDKVKIARILKPLKFETITLKQALKLLEYPKLIGSFEKNQIMLHQGNENYYISCGAKTYSIDNEKYNISKLQLDDCKKIMDEYNKQFLWRAEDDTNLYKAFEGKYGKCVSIIKKKCKRKPIYVKLPDDVDVNTLSPSKVFELLKLKNKRFYKKKKN